MQNKATAKGTAKINDVYKRHLANEQRLLQERWEKVNKKVDEIFARESRKQHNKEVAKWAREIKQEEKRQAKKLNWEGIKFPKQV